MYIVSVLHAHGLRRRNRMLELCLQIWLARYEHEADSSHLRADGHTGHICAAAVFLATCDCDG